MQIKKDDCLQIIMVDSNFRYGYVERILDRGNILIISLHEEGDSKLKFDSQSTGWKLSFEAANQETKDFPLVLTEVEKKIAPLLARNFTTTQIAETLGVTPATIRVELRTMRIKLHLENKIQLIALCQGLQKEATR